MSSPLSRWNAWLFPELSRFPDEASRRAASWEFQKRVGVINWRLGVVLLVAVPFGLLTPMAVPYFRTYLPLQSPMGNVILGGALLGLVPGLLFALFLNWSFRKPLRRFLREKLNTLGIPTCVGCGYDTRDLSSPRCPECGRAFERAA